jgi:hypothetical protein
MIGQTISHYRVIEKPGGRMGVMYKGEAPYPGPFVALKFLPEISPTARKPRKIGGFPHLYLFCRGIFSTLNR